PFAISHRYLDDPAAGAYLVHFVWRDDRGGSNSRTLPVVVANAAPVLALAAPPGLPADRKGGVTLAGVLADPGVRDAHAVTVTWGDGTAPDVLRLPAGAASFSATHRYRKRGAFLVHLSVADESGGPVADHRLVLNLRGAGRAAQAQAV